VPLVVNKLVHQLTGQQNAEAPGTQALLFVRRSVAEGIVNLSAQAATGRPPLNPTFANLFLPQRRRQ
jgi:hypothetical protein